MSAVINRAKLQYRKALFIEWFVILGLSFLFLMMRSNSALSFFSGCLASFIPHCVFVYWVFFRNTAKDRTKMTAFYWGEGIKWLTAISLLIASLTLIPSLQILLFFSGYFLALFLNIFLPMLVSRQTT
ncbi:ATP synthase subunit I [Actinobacillus vicugnae]|uniref:ATP synthase subunit I n=1 Tax=Actinobacillus vicugnae TaxID=2573093 RepID=UPI00123F70E4|nr:ATP synthase subunit I [Actinobacillus vicugnae]